MKQYLNLIKAIDIVTLIGVSKLRHFGPKHDSIMLNFQNHKVFRVKSIWCLLQGNKDPFPVQCDSDCEPDEHGCCMDGQKLSMGWAVQGPVQGEVLLQEFAADVQEQRVLT